MSIAMPIRTNGVGVQVEDTQICVVMVGLPARGKSLIAQKGGLMTFLLVFDPAFDSTAGITLGLFLCSFLSEFGGLVMGMRTVFDWS